jgi:ribulose-5-phosphate 4-epimerase/fuculose-1-phosphate aldolase
MALDQLEQKQQLSVGCTILDQFGIFDEQGHLSARIEDDPGSICVNGNTSPGTAGIQEFETISLDESGYPDTVPGETPIHAQIYRRRDDVGAVCHNHSPYAVIVASAGLDLRPVHQVGTIQAGPVAVYDEYDEEGGTLITTDREAAQVADLLGDDRALVLRGHGAVVAGSSVTEAVLGSLKLEYNAMLIYHQASLGEPWYLPEHVIEQNVELVWDERKMEKSIDYYLEKMDVSQSLV